ncbi:MAG: phosphoribosylformylglycinamidine cyclo-ligase [Stellaceae bacterium]
MTGHDQQQDQHKAAGVDIAEAQRGLDRIIAAITGTWPGSGIGAVKLPIGTFANVIDIGGGQGLALCTDGVGSKSIIAQMLGKYDTIGIDCVAMNVNDLICLGARPLSMVDYIAVERADAAMLGALAEGLAEGARQAGISISGGEIAQLKDSVRGFDLVGMAVGTVPLDRILLGRDLVAGDVVIGLESSGIHANGMTLARHVLFERAGLAADRVLPELGVPLGEELLRPTLIYVREILDLLGAVPGVKALVNVTGDGFLNLPRVAAPVGFVLDNLPPEPPIFRLIERIGRIARAEMFEVYNMGVGFCVLLAAASADAVLALLARHGRKAQVIGHLVADAEKRVRLPHESLIGRGKRFIKE